MNKLLSRFLKTTVFTNDEWDMINADITNDMSISALVQKYGIKKSYMKEYISYVTGMKVIDYVRTSEIHTRE